MRSQVMILAAACAAVAIVAELARAAQLSPQNLQEWEAYKLRFGKSYGSPEEEAQRFSLFMQSKARLALLRGLESHQRGLNHMSDWTQEEFMRLNGLRMPLDGPEAENSPESEDFLESILKETDGSRLPKEVDWRKVPGRVSPVKNQGNCGSCWAFATTGLLEGQEVVRAHANKSLIALSEQDLVDCSNQNLGCEGGLMAYALEDIASMGGIESEKDYPYEAVSGTECKFSKKLSVMSDVGANIVKQKREDIMKRLVASYGPVSVAIDATYLRDYESGVFKGERCTNQKESLNHGVLIVGYGTDAEHGDYWLIKNSWSQKWGEQGYFRMARNKNTCGVSLYPVIAVF